MSTVATAAAALFGIILISAVACGSSQSHSDIVAEPETTATPTAKATEPQADDERSDQAADTDGSDQTMELDKDPDDDASEQTMETDKDPETDISDQTTELDKDPETDISEQAAETVEVTDDVSEQTTEIDVDPETDVSDQAAETVEVADDDVSDQAAETVEVAGDDVSDQAAETVEVTDDDVSDQAAETVEVTDDDIADQAAETVEITNDDISDQTADTVEVTDDDIADQAAETVEEEPEPGDNETVRVGRDEGERVLDFSITLEDGTALTTQDLVSAGRPVFIYFFTTWCPVCRRDLAELQTIYLEYAGAVDFIVVGQDPSEPLSELVSYRERQGQSWPVALAGPRMLADLRITSQAFKLAFDTGGVITYRAGYGDGNPDVWRSVIADLASG